MKRKLLLLLFVCTYSLCFSQPANDDCVNAEFINVTTSFLSVPFDITDASVNTESACEGDPLDDYIDVWFEFVMPTSGNLFINGSVSNNRFNIYDSCGGTEVACFQTTQTVSGLTQGNTYLIRVNRWLPQNIAGFQAFSIFALEPLPNDDCANAELIAVDETLQTVNFNIVEAQTNNDIGCDGESTTDIKDVWYNFTMPVDGVLEINSEAINRFAIYDACNGNEMACFDGSAFDIPYIIDNLTLNENYVLRVFRSSLLNNSQNQNFTIRAIIPAFPECESITPITLTTGSQDVAFDIDSAVYDYDFGCDANDADQYASFWYEFTMPVTGNLFVATPRATIWDACNGNIVHCNANDGAVIDNLVQGQSYILRYYIQLNDSPTEEFFEIIAYERLPNADCATPEVITGLSADNTTVFGQLRAGNLTNTNACEGTSDVEILELFYELTMPITGNLFIDTPEGNGIAVYDACNGTELYCNSSSDIIDSFKLISGLTQGQTYIIRLFDILEDFAGDGSPQAMNIRVYEQPSNDACSDAETIPTITDASQEIAFDTFGSFINFEETCVGTLERDIVDVWFEFTMPNYPFLYIESFSGNAFSIYNACNGNEMACFNGDNVIDNLIPNQTYVLRVFQLQDISMFHPNKSFNIYGSNSSLGVEEFDVNAVNIYPNPTRDFISIDGNAPVKLVTFYNVLGKRVLQTTKTQNISMALLPKGMYFVRIETENGTSITKKILKN